MSTSLLQGSLGRKEGKAYLRSLDFNLCTTSLSIEVAKTLRQYNPPYMSPDPCAQSVTKGEGPETSLTTTASMNILVFVVMQGVPCIRKQGELRIRVTLAHLESQLDEDIPRFRELGVTANFTPHWHGGNDYGTAEQNARLLGPRRAERLFRANSMMDSGANVTFSSDEVTLQLLDRWNPFLGIEVGHTRQEVTRGGRIAAVFPPLSERLPIEDLIQGYTINGARALRLDDQIGSIEAGKSADFMVLDEDLFAMDPYEIHNIVSKAVVMRGACIKGNLS